jgi:hypothetical protein
MRQMANEQVWTPLRVREEVILAAVLFRTAGGLRRGGPHDRSREARAVVTHHGTSVIAQSGECISDRGCLGLSAPLGEPNTDARRVADATAKLSPALRPCRM